MFESKEQSSCGGRLGALALFFRRLTMNNTLTPRLWWTAIGLGFLGWGVSALRHLLLQSNAYDLGLFDQWAWLMSKGLSPISSMENVHVLADHGAWMLYLSGLLYWFYPSIEWLLASQAFALSLTAIPIWMLASQAGLSRRLCWFSLSLIHISEPTRPY